MPITNIAGDVRPVYPMRRAGDITVPRAAGVALVAPAASEPPRSGNGFAAARPDPSFVAQLIATADQSPQTCRLRRAAVADVELAYRSAGRQIAAAPSAGLLARRTA